MVDWPILSLTIFLPLFGAVFLLLIRGPLDVVYGNIRVNLWTTCVTFVLSLFIWWQFDAYDSSFQMVEYSPWFPRLGIGYHIGIDGISLLLSS